MNFEDEYEPQERDELAEKLRELIDVEVKKELGNRHSDLEWLRKEKASAYAELSAARLKIRTLENEKSKFLKEHTKTVQRELFGRFTVGDVVYYAKHHKVGQVHCGTCNNTNKVETKLGERTISIKCPDCPNHWDSIIYEYRPEKDEVRQINAKLWARGESSELKVYLHRYDGEKSDKELFLTIEECQAYCDEKNKIEQEKKQALS